VDRYPAEFLESKIDVFDFLTEKQDKRIARSPAGYLVKSIENDYAAPKSYVSKAERQRREESRQAKERHAAQERRRQHEEDARQKEEQAAIVTYWESLTPQQQSELDEAAKAQADAETLALETGPFKRFSKQIRRDNYIRQLLKNGKPVLVEA
jgi:tyrosyl-tRNA synthetase